MAYYIDENNYYKRDQPEKTEEFINLVQVPVSPLIVQDFDDEAYRGDPILFTTLEEKTIEIKFSDIPFRSPTATVYITDIEGELTYNETSGHISNDTIAITTATYYAWGASLTMTNTELASAYIVIVVSGYPLKAKGDVTPEARDNEGIIENGVLKYKLKKNHLIQDVTLGQEIADTLLDSFSIARKDVALDWRGNLCLRLMDEIETIEYNKNGILTTGEFYIYKQVTEYDGTLKQITNGRKII